MCYNRAMENTHLHADGTTNVKKPYPIFAATESLARKALSTLDARQAIFAAKFVETFDVPSAAAEANYEESHGYQLIKHPQVARAIQLLQTAKLHKIESALPVNAEMVINGIVRNIHALEAKGKNEATFKGYELLGKHLSMWTENINVSDTTPPLSEPERASKIAALMALAKSRAEARTVDVTAVEVVPPPQTPAEGANVAATPLESSQTTIDDDTPDEDLI